MINILITGGNGQLGQELQMLSSLYPTLSLFVTSRKELDIGKKKSVEDLFASRQFDYCINCAAYTQVDKAESEHELAERINVDAARWLAEYSAQQGCRLVHLSTDYVYHNSQNTPFVESDPTHPKGVYARTKLAGERAAQKANPETMIIRTSWVYSAFGNNFVKTMLRLGKEREELGVIFDQIGSPTYARDLAQAILDIIIKVENKEVEVSLFSNVYHYSNEGVCSWYDFAKAIFDINDIVCRVNPIETVAYPTPASRPPFSLLNKAKIKKAFGIEIPYWRESLERMMECDND